MTIEYSAMPQASVDAFLREPRYAVMATNRVDGPPQQTPVWFRYESGKAYVSMSNKSLKYKHLRRDPRASLCVPATHPDARGVVMTGAVELFSEGHTPWVDELVWKLVRRYYDNDADAKAYMASASSDGPGVLAVLSPLRLIAQDYN